jgi:hypothetical protein
VLPNRVIQLEGLVMDKAFLGYLRHATSIMDVLKRYGVDYVATGPRVQAESCYLTSEPSQAGDDSFKLKSRVCAPVVDTFTLDGYATVVFRTNK